MYDNIYNRSSWYVSLATTSKNAPYHVILHIESLTLSVQDDNVECHKEITQATKAWTPITFNNKPGETVFVYIT